MKNSPTWITRMKSTKKYTDIEETICNLLKQTIGKQKIRTDKVPKIKSPAITRARKEKKTAKKGLKKHVEKKWGKIIEKEKYQQAQRNLRNELEKLDRENIEKRLKMLQNRAKKDPNIMPKCFQRAGVVKRSCSTPNLISVCSLKQSSGGT